MAKPRGHNYNRDGALASLTTPPSDRIRMTTHNRNVVASIDPVKLDRLAETAVKVGLRLKAGQDLLLTAPVSALCGLK